MEKKKCNKCGKTHPIEDFGFKVKKRNLRHSHCRLCRNEARAAAKREQKLRRSNAPKEFVFDRLLTAFVAKHARKPQQARYEVLMVGPIYRRCRYEGLMDNADLVYSHSRIVERVAAPLYGHPTGVRYV